MNNVVVWMLVTQIRLLNTTQRAHDSGLLCGSSGFLTLGRVRNHLESQWLESVGYVESIVVYFVGWGLFWATWLSNQGLWRWRSAHLALGPLRPLYNCDLALGAPARAGSQKVETRILIWILQPP